MTTQVEELSPKQCSNCLTDISAAMYTIHTARCARFVTLCPMCNTPQNIDQLQAHIDEAHAKAPCDLCGTALSPGELHECPMESQRCEFCELDLPRCDIGEHMAECGSRTTFCEECNFYVLNRTFLNHVHERNVPKPPSRVDNESELARCDICNEPFRGQDVFEHMRSCSRTAVAVGFGPNSDLVIPCEFCDVAIPMELLIYHQAECGEDRQCDVGLSAASRRDRINHIERERRLARNLLRAGISIPPLATGTRGTATGANPASRGNTAPRGNLSSRGHPATRGNSAARGNLASRGSSAPRGSLAARGNPAFRGNVATRGTPSRGNLATNTTDRLPEGPNDRVALQHREVDTHLAANLERAQITVPPLREGRVRATPQANSTRTLARVSSGPSDPAVSSLQPGVSTRGPPSIAGISGSSMLNRRVTRTPVVAAVEAASTESSATSSVRNSNNRRQPQLGGPPSTVSTTLSPSITRRLAGMGLQTRERRGIGRGLTATSRGGGT